MFKGAVVEDPLKWHRNGRRRAGRDRLSYRVRCFSRADLGILRNLSSDLIKVVQW